MYLANAQGAEQVLAENKRAGTALFLVFLLLFLVSYCSEMTLPQARKR